MMALSIQQPWAELIIAGYKTIEIRSWFTNYRGNLWLHAGKKVDSRSTNFYFSKGFLNNSILPKGAYLGIIELSAIVPLDHERWLTWQQMHLDQGAFQPNSFAWVISTIKRFEHPVPGSGNLRLFTPDDISLSLLLKEMGKP